MYITIPHDCHSSWRQLVKSHTEVFPTEVHLAASFHQTRSETLVTGINRDTLSECWKQ